MQIILFYNEGVEKPWGVIGLDNDGKVFQEGFSKVEEEWIFMGEVFDRETGKVVMLEKDGVEFLRTLQKVMLASSEENGEKVIVKGPMEVDKVLPLDEKRIDPEEQSVYEDLKEGGSGEGTL